MPQISRCVKWTPTSQLSLATTLGATPEIPMQEFVGGSIGIPSGSPITTLTFYGAIRTKNDKLPTVPADQADTAATFYAMHTNDSLDTAITLTVSAGNIYQLPTAIFALGAIKITVNSAGTAEVSFKG